MRWPYQERGIGCTFWATAVGRHWLPGQLMLGQTGALLQQAWFIACTRQCQFATVCAGWQPSQVAPMGMKRGSHVCAAAGGQLFSIGGWDAAEYLDAVSRLFGTPRLRCQACKSLAN